MTMAVHVGKYHGETIIYGLCNCVMEDQEMYETYLLTCAIYQCYYEKKMDNMNLLGFWGSKPSLILVARFARANVSDYVR
jgi:hypothetical protein